MNVLSRQMYWFRRLGLGAKTGLILIGYSLVMLAVIAAVVYRDGTQQANLLTRERLAGLTLAGEQYIREFTEGIRRDVSFLSHSVPLQDMLAALAAGSPGELAAASTHMERLLLAFLASRPAIYQARVINGATGDELVRVQRDLMAGTVQTAPLQNKRHRDYFAAMLAQPPGRLYVSTINLNRENGAVEVPHRPSIRFGQVVGGAGDQPPVMIVFNVGFRHLAFRLAQLYGDSAKLMLFNDKGQVLSHPDPSLEFDFDTSAGQNDGTPGTTFKDLFGLDFATLFAPKEGEVQADRVIRHDGAKVMFHRMRLHPSSDRAIVLGAERERSLYAGALHSVLDHAWTLAVGFLVFGLILFAVMSGFLLRPLYRLVDQIDAYEPGKSLTRPGAGLLGRQDEFGYLARGLRAMSHRIEAQMRAAREARNDMRQVFDAGTDAIVLVSDLGVIEDANRAVERLFGWKRHEILGRRSDILLPPEDAQILDPERLRRLNGDEIGVVDRAFLTRAVTRHGRIVPVTLDIATLGEPQWRRYVINLHDMSEAVALETAREASAAKSRFLANMSHELRTPLNAVTLHAEMIVDAAEDNGDSEMQEDAANIKNAANHLLDLINGILDLARIESGRLELSSEPVALDDLVEEINAFGVTLARKQNNAFEIETSGLPATVTLDRLRLRQCVLNLVSNAAKFTRNGRITMRMERGPADLIIAISDTGIGMTEEEMGRIFGMFEQANTYVHGSHGGSGVGLALTRSIMDLMGGGVHVESRKGEGTTFELRIPLLDAPQQRDQARPSSAQPMAPANDTAPSSMVMVVDGDDQRRAALMKALTSAGHRVVGASSPEDAAERGGAHRPDAVVAVGLDDHGAANNIIRRFENHPALTGVPVMTLEDPKGNDTGNGVLFRNLTCGRERPVSVGAGQDVLNAVQACVSCGSEGAVVVVEDDPNMLHAIARALDRTGLPVIRFDNGSDALAFLRRSTPAMVLLDLALPGTGGFDIVRTMRASARLATVPVTVITGIDLTLAEQAWLREHCDNVLRKGDFELEALTEMLVSSVQATQLTCLISGRNVFETAADPASRLRQTRTPEVVSGE
ncbi:ATP-binding protein [Rhodospira trueperi]|uniref:histidine kinase n=1 Tax=Rhodospira trueperi TaxID=69960 RepID=A0A1G7FS44_9PROT|nr:ATP-binding protein [Rhodospira trueperi]SDE78733.1 PAS domain S-box-containing protein [Rhodospira trueperi]